MSTCTINNRVVAIEGEKNILELARKAHIDIPTFCYHSELSVYGACRLCLVEVEGRGLVTSCSTKPVEGMKIFTNTEKVQRLRRTIVEMLLANHTQTCTTCERSSDCRLRELSNRMGITKVRYRPTKNPRPLDTNSLSLERDPNKCVLCGDCVRFCSEIQGVGAIDFTNRGEEVLVAPAFNKNLRQVNCVNCGQCAAVCPTGAIVIKSQTRQVWEQLNNPKKTVVAQVAPAVRVALGEMFGMPSGEITTGKLVAALKMLGFDHVYDTSFAADLTVIEEANEFLARKTKGENLPIFTSCCPAWVKYAEQNHPELLHNLSSCRSPQQMFGSLAKKILPGVLNVAREDMVVVSVMPCTAKKFEAARPEFTVEGQPDVDYAITTQELGRMIKEMGLNFDELEPESMGLPLGFASGAGVIFGNAGGVSEAVLRYAMDKLHIPVPENGIVLQAVEATSSIRETTVTTPEGMTIKMALVYGLKAAGELAERVKAGTAQYDLVEVMACPGGCIGGAGQPISVRPETRLKRAKALSNVDKSMPLHRAQDNPFIRDLYDNHLGEPNSEAAHHLLHTHYYSRRRIEGEEISLGGSGRTPVRICVGTSCYLRGAQELLASTLKTVKDNGWQDRFDIAATFCTERCDKGPTVVVGESVIHHATPAQVAQALAQNSKAGE